MISQQHPHKQRPANHGRRYPVAVLTASILIGALVTFAALPGAIAYAGEWMQVSCVNPNQSPAPSQGWTSFWAAGGYGSNNSTSLRAWEPDVRDAQQRRGRRGRL